MNTSILVRLKRLLATIPDNDLKQMELWVNGQDEVDSYILEPYSLTLVGKDAKVKINDYEL